MVAKKRPLISLILAVALVLAIASVGSAQQVELLVNTFSGQQVMHDWLEWLTQKYMEENPHVKVEWIHASGDHFLTLMAGGVGPDVIHLGQNWGDNIVFLMDLSQYLERNPGLTADIIPGLRGTFEFQGATWAIPFSASTWGLAVNEPLLAANGLAPPSRDWTWTEAMSWMKSISRDTDGDGMNDTWGISLWWQPWNHLAYAGSFYTEDLRNSNIMNPVRVQAADLFIGIWSGREGVMPSGYAGVSDAAIDLFSTGKLAFVEMGIFQIPAYRDAMTQEWSVQHYPYFEYEGQLLTGGSYTLEGYGINKDSANTEEALRFLEFMYRPDNIGALVRQGAIMPPKMSLVEDFLAFHTQPRNVQIYLEALDFHQKPSNHPAFGRVFASMFGPIWNTDRGHDGSQPAEYIIEEMHHAVQRGLDDFYAQYER